MKKLYTIITILVILAIGYFGFFHNWNFKQELNNETLGATIGGQTYYGWMGPNVYADSLNASSTLNVTGTSTLYNDLNVSGYATYKQVYGSLSEDTSGVSTGSTIVMTSVGVFYPWKGASSTLSMQAGASYLTYGISAGTTSTMTIGTYGGGVYQMSFSMSVSVSSANETIHCAIFKNGTKFSRASGEAHLGNTTDVVAIISSPTFATFVAGDVIDLRCADEDQPGRTLTVNHAQLGLLRISR